MERCGEGERFETEEERRACWSCSAFSDPSRAEFEAATSFAISPRVSWRSLASASCRTVMTVCWREMICAWSWFSVMAGVVSVIRGVLYSGWHTVAARKSVAVPPVHVVVHALDHHAVAAQILTHVVAVIVAIPASSAPTAPLPTSVLQAINLLLPLIGPLLRLLELLVQVRDLVVLLGVSLLLLVRLASVMHALPQAHGGGEGADQRAREGRADERFLEAGVSIGCGGLDHGQEFSAGRAFTFRFFSSIHDA
jgi:hypothetical protein